MLEDKKDRKYKLSQQRKLGVGLLLSGLIIYSLLHLLLPNIFAYSWLFGLVVGFILQRTRICFTAAIRDPLLFGMTELSRGLIISLMVSSFGFAILQYFRLNQGLSVVGRFVPLGWHIPIGALVFGLGAAVSGGCASGTLMRIGEGFAMQIVVLIGFIIGATHGAYDAGWWYQSISDQEITHLPSLVGWKTALGLQFGLLLLLYLFAVWWEKHQFDS